MHHVAMTARGPTTIMIADDFTGACDTGVQLAEPGSPCPVVIASPGADDTTDSAETAARENSRVVYDTESRHLAAQTAAARVSAVGSAVREEDPDAVIYKKIDSTLRGNVGPELEALMRLFPDRTAVVAPAFPDAGRVTEAGRCLVHGVPVDETEFADDRLAPVSSARVADLFVAGRRVCECAATDAASVVSAAAPGSIVVVDAVDDDDLDAVARALASRLSSTLLVGSAGLARALGDSLFGPARGRSPGRRVATVVSPPARAVLAVVGSLSGRSRVQARALVATGAAEEVLEREEVDAQTARVARTIVAGRDVVLRSPDAVSAAYPGTDELAPENGDPAAAAREVAALLARIASSAVGSVPDVGLVLTGGDTAVATMDALGARTFFVGREVAPGVPAGTVVVEAGGEPRSIPVVTKAGGFGENGVMIEAVAYLKEGLCSR